MLKKSLPLNIDVEKLLQGCDTEIDSAKIEAYKARGNRKAEYCKIYRRAHMARYNELGRKYYAKFAEKNRQRALARYYANHAEYLERGRRYKAEHRNEIKAKMCEYRITHRDEINAQRRKYRAAHRDEINAAQRARYAAKQAAQAAQDMELCNNK